MSPSTPDERRRWRRTYILVICLVAAAFGVGGWLLVWALLGGAR